MLEQQKSLEEFLARNRLLIRNNELLQMALTHPSYAMEHQYENNQRLEFLGDAVLNLVSGEHLYRQYPYFNEGELSQLRSKLVCEETLFQIGLQLKIGEYMLLGKGEAATGGRERKSVLADAVEALIGAFYLDAGIEEVKPWIINLLQPAINRIEKEGLLDYKSQLQELVQSWGKENVIYQLLKESGPSHNKRFGSGVYYKQCLLAEGEGHSKKESEQQAAEKAMKIVKQIKL